MGQSSGIGRHGNSRDLRRVLRRQVIEAGNGVNRGEARARMQESKLICTAAVSATQTRREDRKRSCCRGHGSCFVHEFVLFWSPIMCRLCNGHCITARIATRKRGKPHTRAMSSRTRPVEKFARATAQCSAEVCPLARYSCPGHALCFDLTPVPQATAYGRCIVADYTAVHKDMCAREFMKLKDCYLVWCPRLHGESVWLTGPNRRRQRRDNLNSSRHA